VPQPLIFCGEFENFAKSCHSNSWDGFQRSASDQPQKIKLTLQKTTASLLIADSDNSIKQKRCKSHDIEPKYLVMVRNAVVDDAWVECPFYQNRTKNIATLNDM
jgi:hypothetical protein